MNFRNKRSRIGLILLLSILFTASCTSYKKTLYFQGNTTEIKAIDIANTYKLQPGDLLNIKLFTPDAKSSEFLDANKNSAQVTPIALYFSSYSINDSGYVDLPLTGKLFVQDYTVYQVDSMISIKAKDYFTYATVEVKLASFKFLALGEFKSPNYHFVYNDKCTIFEAIAIAGDATDFANKTKLQLIRTLPDHSKKVYHIDITNYDSFTSETFYIQPNDILYMQPQKSKVDSKNIQYATLGFAAISSILLVINYISK